MADEGEARVGELWVTPIQVEHTIPTTGFIVHDGETGFVFSGDTGPTREDLAGGAGNARAQGGDRRDVLPEPDGRAGEGPRGT